MPSRAYHLMKTSNRIAIKFDVPYHGWLPVYLQCCDCTVECTASLVPTDPIEQLCDALIQMLKGMPQAALVLWHREPTCYYLQLERHHTTYSLTLLESEGTQSPMNAIRECDGEFHHIILPLYRGVKEFASHNYKPPHWNEVNSKRIAELTELRQREQYEQRR